MGDTARHARHVTQQQQGRLGGRGKCGLLGHETGSRGRSRQVLGVTGDENVELVHLPILLSFCLSSPTYTF